jgi:hypothetical protein
MPHLHQLVDHLQLAHQQLPAPARPAEAGQRIVVGGVR